jgi:hypothetical protein
MPGICHGPSSYATFSLPLHHRGKEFLFKILKIKEHALISFDELS